MKKLLAISFVLMTSCSAYAQEQPQPLLNNPLVNMTYPDVAGDYLIYSQRVHKSHQIMQLNRHQLSGSAKHVDAAFDNEVVRYGAAIANGDIAFVSNRLGAITPWLTTASAQVAINIGVFQSVLMPNHLDVSANGHTWVFDSTLESSHALCVRLVA